MRCFVRHPRARGEPVRERPPEYRAKNFSRDCRFFPARSTPQQTPHCPLAFRSRHAPAVPDPPPQSPGPRHPRRHPGAAGRPGDAPGRRPGAGPGRTPPARRHSRRPAGRGPQPLRRRGRRGAVVRCPADPRQAQPRSARRLQRRPGLRRAARRQRPAGGARERRQLLADRPAQRRRCPEPRRHQHFRRRPGRHHRGHRRLHHRRDAQRTEAAADPARNPAVGHRGHPPADGRPGRPHHQRRAEPRAGHLDAGLRQRPHGVLHPRLRHHQLPVRRRQQHLRRRLRPGHHAHRHGHLRPRGDHQRRHRPDDRRRRPVGHRQPGAQAADPRIPGLGDRQRRLLGQLPRRGRRLRRAERRRHPARPRGRRVSGPQLLPRSLRAAEGHPLRRVRGRPDPGHPADLRHRPPERQTARLVVDRRRGVLRRWHGDRLPALVQPRHRVEPPRLREHHAVHLAGTEPGGRLEAQGQPDAHDQRPRHPARLGQRRQPGPADRRRHVAVLGPLGRPSRAGHRRHQPQRAVRPARPRARAGRRLHRGGGENHRRPVRHRAVRPQPDRRRARQHLRLEWRLPEAVLPRGRRL
ncbi:hypothetical protein D9M68_231930 [compost metagenome]